MSCLSGRGHGPQFFQNCRIFGNSDASSESYRIFAVGKDKGFESYQKVIELAPYSTHLAGGGVSDTPECFRSLR